jgi:N-acetyltransferase 10
MVAWFEQRSRGEASFAEGQSKTKRSKGAASSGDGGLLAEELAPREAPPLLQSVSEAPPLYALDYIGTSFGMTLNLYEFWHKAGFKPVYMRQTAHDATGEHSCILLRHLVPLERPPAAAGIVNHFNADFRQRFLRLLQGPFQQQPTRLALSVLDPPTEASSSLALASGDDAKSSVDVPESQSPLTAASLLQFLSRDDLHRLEQYGRNLVDYALVLDFVPALATLFLGRRMPGVHLSQAQCAMMVAVGCQHRTFDQVAADLGAPVSQLLALFNKAMHKLSNYCRDLLVSQIEEEEDQDAAVSSSGASRRPLKSGEVLAGGKFVKESLKEAQDAGAKKVQASLDTQRQDLLTSLMKDEYSVAARGEDFSEALAGRSPTSGSLSVKKHKRGGADDDAGQHGSGKKQRK